MNSIILRESVMGYMPGTLGSYVDNAVLLENGESLGKLNESKYHLLDVEYSNFLRDFPIEKRTAMIFSHEFQSLKSLMPGKKCYVKLIHETCTILEKMSIENHLRFKIETKSGVLVVKASEIKRKRSKSDMILETGQNMKRSFSMVSKRIPIREFIHSGKFFSGSESSTYIDNECPVPLTQPSYDARISLIDWRYIRISSNLSTFKFTETFEKYKVTDLVEILDDRGNLFGRIAFFLTDETEHLIGINSNDDAIKKLVANFNEDDKVDEILFKDRCLDRLFNGFIVQHVFVESFSHDLVRSTTKPPLLCPSSFKFVEIVPFEKMLKGDFVRLTMPVEFNYGKIERTLIINDECCVEFFPIYSGRLQDTTETLREKDVTKIIDLKDDNEIEFYDGVLICPDNIVIMEPYDDKDWRKNDDAFFVLRGAGDNFSVTVLCTLKINELPSAIIQLRENEKDDGFHRFLCKEKLLCQLACDVVDRAYLIPLSLLHRDKSKDVLEILKYILVNKDNWLDNIINEALTMREESILSFLIGHIERDIDLELSPDLLNTLFQRKDFQTLQVLLGKSKSGANSNLVLLDLAYTCLQLGNRELFDTLVDKCSDRNILLDNDETFITNLIKTNMTEETITDIIQGSKFDVTLRNKNEETPITLATERLMRSTIESLLKSSKVDQYQLRKARDIILKDDGDPSDEESSKRFQILKLLQNYTHDDICPVCLDRNTKVAFDCGHSYCEECSNEIVECSLCKAVPNKRIILFK